MLDQFIPKSLTNVKKLAMLSMISVVAATLLDCFGAIISLLQYYSLSKNFFIQFSYTLAGNIQWLLCGLLLPVSLLLLSDSPQKEKLIKIFTIAAFAFVGLQLFSVIVGFISSLARANTNGFLVLMNSISGNDLLNIIAYFLRGLFYGYSITFSGLLSNLISSICSILYIVPNALCLLGFIKTK